MLNTILAFEGSFVFYPLCLSLGLVLKSFSCILFISSSTLAIYFLCSSFSL